MNINDFIQGLIIGLTLIIAIGPQNLFIINQGLKKSYVLLVVLFCSLSDSILIIIGINLSSLIVSINSNAIVILKIIGGIWLIIYGLNKIRQINKIRNLENIIKVENNLKKILITLFLITYANPHVYLDTIILIGSISSNFDSKIFFGIGAVMASFIFFFTFFTHFIERYFVSLKINFIKI